MKLLSSLGKVAIGVTTAAAATAAAPAIATVLATLAVEYVIGEFIAKSISSILENIVKNLQVLTVFPLKRYGLTFTAGLGGSKGLVYGSPTYNEQGALQSLIGSVMGRGDNPVLNFIKGMFFSDDLMGYATKLRRDTGAVGENGEALGSEADFDNLLLVASGNSGNGNDKNVVRDYREMQFVPRARNNKERLMAYQYFALTDVDNYQNSPKLQHVELISGDKRIIPYIQEDFFNVIHEKPELNAENDVDIKQLKVNGKESTVKVIHSQNSKGEEILDMPLLNHEALNVLAEIIRRAKNNMPSANASDKNEAYEETKMSRIILVSALRVGDTQSYSSTGYTFILQGFDKAASALADATNDFVDELKNDAKGNSVLQGALFSSKDLGENRIAYTVMLPRISAEYLSDENSNDAEANQSNDEGEE